MKESLKKVIQSPVSWVIFLFFFFDENKRFIGLLLMIILFIYFNKKHTTMNSTNDFKNVVDVTMKKTKKYSIITLIVILTLVILSQTFVIIQPGFAGVYQLFGKVNDTELSSGLHIINPLGKIEQMDIRTKEYTMSIASNEGRVIDNDSIDALTKEGLTVALDITVLYSLNQDQASDVYQTVGTAYEDTIIRPQIRNAIRKVIATFNARDIYSEKRSEAESKIKDDLKIAIEPRGIKIESVLLRNVKLPEKLSDSIQEKLTAEQESQRYEFLLETERKEADRKRIEAEGQRDAQKIISEGLTDQYLYYLYVSELKNRPGTIYVPTSSESGLPLFKSIE